MQRVRSWHIVSTHTCTNTHTTFRIASVASLGSKKLGILLFKEFSVSSLLFANDCPCQFSLLCSQLPQRISFYMMAEGQSFHLTLSRTYVFVHLSRAATLDNFEEVTHQISVKTRKNRKPRGFFRKKKKKKVLVT